MQVRVTPNGVLDHDTDIQYIGQGNYVDALNIRHRDIESNNTDASVNFIKGNALSLTLPNVVDQNKLYRIYLSVSGLYTGTSGSETAKTLYNFTDLSGVNITNTVSTDRNVKLIGLYTTLFSALNSAVSPASISNVTSSSIVITKYREHLNSANNVRTLTSINTTLNRLDFALSFIGEPTYVNGDRVIYKTAGTAIGGLTKNQIYYVKYITGISVELYTDRALTSIVDITGTLSGTHTLGRIEDLEGYFDISSNLDESWILKTSPVENYPEIFQRELIQEAVAGLTAINEPLNIIGSVEVENETFLFSTTKLIPYGYASALSGEGLVRYGEVGYLKYDELSNTHTYIRLLRSKDLGFNENFQIQGEGEKTKSGVNLYVTDNNTTPRAIYLKRPYIQDGALSINGGFYNLDSVLEETNLFQSIPSSYMSFEQIKDGAGNLLCGTKRYTGFFLTEGLSPSEYLYPTGPIVIYPKKSSNHIEISGGDINEIAQKSVLLSLTDIPKGVYKYFDFVVIEYNGEGVVAKKLRRYSLGENDTVLELEHNGFGELNELISFEEIVTLYSKYTKVQNLKLFSNRLLISNLTEKIDEDLSDWAKTINHSVQQTFLDSVGLMGLSTLNANPAYKFGEYQDPSNVFYFSGYMFNDTYRFGIQVKWNDSGKWSQPYWVDDIRIDNLSYNIKNDTTNRRTSNTVLTNLTKGENALTTDPDWTTETTVYYINFEDINLSYTLSDGRKLKESVSAIRFVRSERIPEVIAAGLFVLSEPNFSPGFVLDDVQPFLPIGSYSEIFSSGYPSATTTDGDYVTYFISPDYYYGQTNYEYQSGDKLKMLGTPLMLSGDKGIDRIDAKHNLASPFSHQYQDYTGFVNDRDYFDIAVSNGITLIGDTPILIDGTIPVNKKLRKVGGTTTDTQRTSTFSHAFKIASPTGTNNFRKKFDNGLAMGQVFRDKGANLKYPTNKEQSLYYGTGHLRKISIFDADFIDESVFGGDVFTQKTHLKLFIPDKSEGGPGYGVGFYSQNVVNTQLATVLEHTLADGGPGYKFPQYLYKKNVLGTFSAAGLDTWGSGLISYLNDSIFNSNQDRYNKGYNIKNDVISEAGFDSNNDYDGRKSSSLAWSQIKVIGSSVDGHRLFMPNDILDLDMTYGEIANHEVINNAIYTWQEKSFQRQYFNEGTLVNPQSGADIVLGTGSFAGPRGAEISSIGTNKKWSIVKGKTPGGKDSVYWYNDKLKKFMRFGQDGIKVISEGKISSVLQNNFNFLGSYEQPISNYGINGVWNDKYSEAIFTFKAIDPNIIDYPNGGTYTTGSLVINTTGPLLTSGLSYIYQAKSNFTVSSDDQEPGVGSSWTTYWNQLTPTSNPEYYTIYTIVYDELSNGFITYASFWPSVYVQNKNTFYSVNPLQKNKLYLHDVGNYGSFYGVSYDGHITAVMNYEPNVSKNYDALQVNSHIAPSSVNFYTKNHTSTTSDFVGRENFFYGQVKNDSTGTGVSTGNTSRLWGPYLKAKINFQSNNYQKLFNFIVKFRPMARLYNT